MECFWDDFRRIAGLILKLLGFFVRVMFPLSGLPDDHFNYFDKNSDGKISWDTFWSFMETYKPHTESDDSD